ncbi:uroporphyrinogen-III synthase [Arenicella xantha]|uniref:uroporphyrinogen-III synthase n=1 Tax=Arenicella xantha TaxID=644221 RepID=UPI001FE92432|nr:uroporphyrinogen-III synthase [Arenicella xantha]
MLNTISRPTVILTRQEQFLGNTAAILHRLDYTPTHVPTLAVAARQDAELVEVLQQLDTFTDIIFVSRNAVEYGFPLIQNNGGLPAHARVMAVGAETAKQLFRHGVNAHFPEQGHGAEALLMVDTMQDLKNRKLLIMRGENGLDWPADEMRQRGGEVFEAKIYRIGLPSQSASLLSAAIKNSQKIEGVFVHSQQSVNNLLALAGSQVDELLATKMVAGSDNIAGHARKLGWQGEILIAESPSNKHMMIAFSR